MNAQVQLNVPCLDRKFEALWKHYFASSLLGGLEHWDRRSHAYRDTFIFLITKASRDYRSAREIVLAHHGLLGPQANLVIVEFPFVFEDCINSLHRAIYVGDFLVGEGRLRDEFKIESHQGGASKVRRLRDMLQHIVPRVLENRKDGEPIRLMPSEEGAYVELAKFRLSFIEVVAVLHWLFDAAKSLVSGFDEAIAEEVAPAPFHLTISASLTITHGSGVTRADG